MSGVAEQRAASRARYLQGTTFRSARLVRLGSDASIRQYFRLEGGPQPALLMDAPAAAINPPCPPTADAAERTRLGYGALVRGSGSSLIAYEAAANVLSELNIRVPRVLHRDVEAGFAIIEDLGTERVADAAEDAGREEVLYRQAADVLITLGSASAKPGLAHGWTFQTYDHLAYTTEANLLAEWFFPKILDRRLSEEDQEALSGAWSEALSSLSQPNAWVHRDFHADNLMVVGDGIGVLDFQDLMVGQSAYDWASLIEDARRDVGQDLRDSLYRLGADHADDHDAFERDYALLAAQRNAKILGLFARLAARDGKERYLNLIPRVRTFFAEDLARPALAPVTDVLHALAPELVTP
ncbi:MAG: phosphotransferase [Pseudomonadota bacterium]